MCCNKMLLTHQDKEKIASLEMVLRKYSIICAHDLLNLMGVVRLELRKLGDQMGYGRQRFSKNKRPCYYD